MNAEKLVKLQEIYITLKNQAKWHKKQWKSLTQQYKLYQALISCRDEGAIMLDTGSLAKKIHSDRRFRIVKKGLITVKATTILNEKGKKCDIWRFDLTDSTTLFTFDNHPKIFKQLPYRLFIPDLDLEYIDTICDQTLLKLKSKPPEGQISITFELPIILVTVNFTHVTFDLPEPTQQHDSALILNSLKPQFAKIKSKLTKL